MSLGDIKGKISDDQRTGEDYSLKKQFEEKENGSKSEENSDDQIFHQSKKTLNNDFFRCRYLNNFKRIS